MVETKTLTLTLAEVPVGEEEFRFDAYDPFGIPPEPRELFVVGTTWPVIIPKTYDVGETIRLCFRIKNIGTAVGDWTVTAKDLDTGATIETWSGKDIKPDFMWVTHPEGVLLGKMPDRDWRISVKVTP